MANSVNRAIVINFNIETRHDIFVWGGYGVALYLAYNRKLSRYLALVLSEAGLSELVARVLLALAIYLVMSAQWRFVAKRVVYDEAHPVYWRRVWAGRFSFIAAVVGSPVYFATAALLALMPALALEALWGLVPFGVDLLVFPAMLVGCFASGFWSGWRSGRYWALVACLGLAATVTAVWGAFPEEAVDVLLRMGRIWPWLAGGVALCGIGAWAGERYFHMSMKRIPRTYVLPQENI